MALWLCAQPASIGQTGSLRRALQRIAWLTAEADNTAHRKLLS